MNNALKARKIPITEQTGNIRCHFDNGIIPMGSFATHVTGDQTVKGQGIFHSRICYERALKKYEELQKST